MDRPWGLSGPAFLVLYGAATIAVCVAFFATRGVIRRVGHGAAPPAHLTLYEWAYLHDGETRVVEAALAGLLHSQCVRVSRRHGLQVTGPIVGDEFQQLLMATIPRKKRPRKLSGYLKRSGACQPLKQKMRADGLLIGRDRHLALGVVWLLFPALGVLAIARMAAGSAHGHPVGWLILEFVVMINASFVAIMMCASPVRTVRGNKLLRASDFGIQRVGTQHRPKPEIRLPIRPPTVGGAVAMAVAEGGFRAYPDRKVAQLVTVSAGGGSGSSGDGSAGDDGGGCGGGGD